MWPFYLLLNKLLYGEDDEEDAVGLDGDVVNVGGWHQVKPSSGGRACFDAALPVSQFIEVMHVNQLHSWDCGVTCVLMVLNAIGIKNCCLEALIDLCGTTSIWTVDLVFLLLKFPVKFSYFTVTIGVNPNYSDEKFYEEQLPTDLIRVDTLFQKAVAEGVDIQCRSVNERELSRLILSGKYLAIALVDLCKFRYGFIVLPKHLVDSFDEVSTTSRQSIIYSLLNVYLSRSWLEDVIVSSMRDSSLGYTGHYIVICGYDASSDEFEIRDPASSRDKISSKCLEEARRTFGTDEDLILISLECSDNR